MEYWYHVFAFAAVVLAYWLVRAFAARLGMPKRLLAAEGASQALFAGIWLLMGIRSDWYIFLMLAPAAGLLTSDLCFAVDGAASLGKRKGPAYYIGLAVFLALPVLTLALPPIGALWRELIFWSVS